MTGLLWGCGSPHWLWGTIFIWGHLVQWSSGTKCYTLGYLPRASSTNPHVCYANRKLGWTKKTHSPSQQEQQPKTRRQWNPHLSSWSAWKPQHDVSVNRLRLRANGQLHKSPKRRWNNAQLLAPLLHSSLGFPTLPLSRQTRRCWSVPHEILNTDNGAERREMEMQPCGLYSVFTSRTQLHPSQTSRNCASFVLASSLSFSTG